MAHPAKDARDNAQAKWPGATVVERSRNGIKHQHPTEPNRFMLDTSIGPLHYGVSEDQEIDTAWQPGTAPWDYEMIKADYNAFALEDFSSGQIIKYVDPVSGEDIAFEPQQLQYTNDLDQIQAIADPQAVIASVQNEDELFWNGVYGTGFDLRWQCQTARLDKRLIVDQASRFPTVQQFIIDGGNPVLRLQFIFQKSNGLDIYVNDTLWNENPNNPVETSGHVEFRDTATGLPAWHFNLPRSFQQPSEDDSGSFVGVFRLRKTGPNLFVEHRIPVSWIQTAAYPIEIDTTLDDQVGAGTDDATEQNDGQMLVTEDYITMGAFGNRRHGGFRFAGISGLSGATINTANTKLTFTPDDNDAQTDVVGDWYAEDAEAAGTFTTDNANLTGRTRTSATCEGDGVDFGSWTADVEVDFIGDGSNTVGDIVQELATDYDPSTIVMLWIFASGIRERLAKSYEQDTSKAAKLHIDYTSGVAAIPNVIYQVPQAINRAGTY